MPIFNDNTPVKFIAGGQLVCQNNAHYEEKQARNIFIVLSGNTLPTGANRDVCLLY